MTTHDKTIYCNICRSLSKLKHKWFKSPCRDCHSWGSSWLYYLIFHLIAQHQDDARIIRQLTKRLDALLRWLIQDLEPALRHSHKNFPEDLFLKVLAIGRK